MRHDFAPMEGLTDSIYRSLHHSFFPGPDRYYMPFLSPTIHRKLTPREERELPLADSVPFPAIAQVLTRVPEDFLWAAQVIRDRGYSEVNLNLGCPSRTVGGKGSAMLGNLQELEAFLDAIFAKSPLPISIKTRLGVADAQEFPAILDIYNRYPIWELTIHPRVRKQFYTGSVDMEMFRYAAANSKNPLCYNGDLLTRADIARIETEFPQLRGIMIGRGLLGDPALLSKDPATNPRLEGFMDALLEHYTAAFAGSRNAMFRLKENWGFLISHFPGSDKLWKRLRKTTDLQEYRNITHEIFRTFPFQAATPPSQELPSR